MKPLRSWRHWISTAAVLGLAVAPARSAAVQPGAADGVDRAAAIEAAIGVYEDEAWGAYLQSVGERMVAAGQRPDLKLRFQTLDDPSINIFPLAPGDVYLTRGLVAYLDSEAELAAILAHAIAHLTERHKVYPLSHEALLGFSLGVADRQSPMLRSFLPILPVGLETVLASYRQNDERRADELAIRALEHAGFDLEALPTLFDVLDTLAKRPEPSRLPGWWTTHPGPDDRAKRAAKEVATYPQSRRTGDNGRGRFLPRLEGLVFGWNLERPYLDKNHYVNPAAGFRIDPPSAWKSTLFGEDLVAVSPEGDAVLHLSPADADSNVAALRSFFQDPRFVARRSWRKSVGNLSAVWATFDVRREERDLEGRVGFVVVQDRVFRLLGYGIERLWLRHLSKVQNSLEGIRKTARVTPGDEVVSARIHLIDMEEELSIGQIEETFPLAVPKRTVRIMNRLDQGRRTAIGEPLKHITGGLDAPDEEEATDEEPIPPDGEPQDAIDGVATDAPPADDTPAPSEPD